MPEIVSMYVCPSKGSDYELQQVIISVDLRSDEIIVRFSCYWYLPDRFLRLQCE